MGKSGQQQQAHIGELSQLGISRSHAQVLTYLPRESRARVTGENKGIAHGWAGWCDPCSSCKVAGIKKEGKTARKSPSEEGRDRQVQLSG